MRRYNVAETFAEISFPKSWGQVAVAEDGTVITADHIMFSARPIGPPLEHDPIRSNAMPNIDKLLERGKRLVKICGKALLVIFLFYVALSAKFMMATWALGDWADQEEHYDAAS